MTTGEVIALIKAFGGGGGGSSGGGVLVVTDTDGTLDKTWQEIHDSAVPVLIHLGTGWFPVFQAEQDALLGTYSVGVIVNGNDGVEPLFYDTSSASGYPSYTP